MFARSKYGGDCAATELMSCKYGMLPICVAKIHKNPQMSQFILSNRCVLDKICLNYAQDGDFMPSSQ